MILTLTGILLYLLYMDSRLDPLLVFAAQETTQVSTRARATSVHTELRTSMESVWCLRG